MSRPWFPWKLFILSTFRLAAQATGWISIEDAFQRQPFYVCPSGCGFRFGPLQEAWPSTIIPQVIASLLLGAHSQMRFKRCDLAAIIKCLLDGGSGAKGKAQKFIFQFHCRRWGPADMCRMIESCDADQENGRQRAMQYNVPWPQPDWEWCRTAAINHVPYTGNIPSLCFNFI